MSKSSESSESKPINKTPWHLWVIGAIAILWSAMAALKFTITQTKYAAYLSAYTPEQLAYFYGIPIWLVISWGVCV